MTPAGATTLEHRDGCPGGRIESYGLNRPGAVQLRYNPAGVLIGAREVRRSR